MATYQLSDIDWFEWNGVKCTDYGMHVLSQPTYVSAAEKVSTVDIPGRSGSLTLIEGTDIYSAISLSCSCVIDDAYYTKDGSSVNRISEIMGWLKGSGEVKFANRTEGYYKGRIANQISFDQVVRGDPHRVFSVQFQCDPFLYLDEGDTAITIAKSASPYKLTNKGNCVSQPLIRLEGTSSGTIMIGDQTMIINDFSSISYILLDCEAKIAYKGARGSASDPLTLLGTRVTGEWIQIPTGNPYVTITGGITKAIITPRWRCR